jgi:hypothetical protein
METLPGLGTSAGDTYSAANGASRQGHIVDDRRGTHNPPCPTEPPHIVSRQIEPGASPQYSFHARCRVSQTARATGDISEQVAGIPELRWYRLLSRIGRLR